MAVFAKSYSGPERRVFAGNYTGVERRDPPQWAQTHSPTRRGRAQRLAQGTDSRAKFLGHPVHQQLVVFPVGLLAAAVVFDLVYLAGGGPTMAVVSFWMIVAGLVGGALAVPFGIIDWLAIPEGTRAKSVGTIHGMGNFTVILLFLLSALIRVNDQAEPLPLALGLSISGGVLALVTAWLGGELVSRLGIGVSSDAGPDATSSLRRHGIEGDAHW
jgi:uncharacterized membrane protein